MALNNEGLAAIAKKLGCRTALVEAIAEPVEFIRAKVLPDTSVDTNDIFMATLFPELARYTRASRSVSSMMGSQFYPRLARALASYRYGTDACPRLIPGGGVTPDELASHKEPPGTDVRIVSRIQKSQVEGLAQRLQKEIKDGHRSTTHGDGHGQDPTIRPIGRSEDSPRANASRLARRPRSRPSVKRSH
jgi:hypothetical protein